MKYYFEDKGKQEELSIILSEWMGTPYRHWAGVKGEGCDCIHLIVRVLEEFGFGPFKVPRYDKDWHIHNNEELLLDGFRKSSLRFDELSPSVEPMNGDVVLYKFGRVNSHSVIYFMDHVYQSINGIGVERRHWMDRMWHKRKRKIVRILA